MGGGSTSVPRSRMQYATETRSVVMTLAQFEVLQFLLYIRFGYVPLPIVFLCGSIFLFQSHPKRYRIFSDQTWSLQRFTVVDELPHFRIVDFFPNFFVKRFFSEET